MQGIEQQHLKFGTELRLRRTLSWRSRSFGAGRCDRLEWKSKTEVQIITGRLQAIQQMKPADWFKSLRSLAAAFEQVRSPKLALRFINILAAAQPAARYSTKETTLMIAELHLSWFEYPSSCYLWRIAGFSKSKSKSSHQVIYLQQLAYIYERAKQYQPAAVTVKQQLVKFYLNEQQFTQIPALRLEIAQITKPLVS